MNRANVIVSAIIFVACFGFFAVFSWRSNERALVQQCKANLQQLAIGMHGYHGTNNQFPLAIVRHKGEIPVEKCASWLFEILAFVESRMDARFMIDKTLPWDAVENNYVADSSHPIASCPANQAIQNGRKWIECSYVGVLGVGREAGILPYDDKACGPLSFRHQFRVQDIVDGSANTILIVETNHDNGRWIAGGFPTARGLDVEGPEYFGEVGQFGSHHRNSFTYAAFVDGTVRALSPQISPHVFEALATIRGGEKIEGIEWD